MKIDPNIQARFLTKPPSPAAGEEMARWRTRFAQLAGAVDETVPDGREKALALTHLELAKYYANQAIILEDNAREPHPELPIPGGHGSIGERASGPELNLPRTTRHPIDYDHEGNR